MPHYVDQANVNIGRLFYPTMAGTWVDGCATLSFIELHKLTVCGLELNGYCRNEEERFSVPQLLTFD